MFECGTCCKSFPAGWRARNNHCRSTGHEFPLYECDTCDRHFSSSRGKWQHMEDKNHFAWGCNDCGETWPDEKGLGQHQIEQHFYCADCNRYFSGLNNIRMHLNSRIHLGENMHCPFCQASYTTANGMVHHLERGACPDAPFLGRDEIFRFVRSKDPSGIISKKLLEWDGDSTYEVGDSSWNGYAWECYFCDKTFASRWDVTQHLNSGVHRQALYHCPNRNCGKDFVTLAATINHLESESCGAMRFATVQRNIGDIVTGNRLITF